MRFSIKIGSIGVFCTTATTYFYQTRKDKKSNIFHSVINAATLIDTNQSENSSGDHKRSTPIQSTQKWNWNWDGRQLSTVDDVKTKACRHIYLIRHGQYTTRVDHEDKKHLTALGNEQAVLVGKALLDSNIKFTRFVQSGLIRAIQTANHVNEYLKFDKIEQDPNLNEGLPYIPDPPGRIVEEIAKGNIEVETARLETAFHTYFHRPLTNQTEDSHEIIVCHGNVIRYFVCRALQIPADAWLRFNLYHCSITHLMLGSNGRVVCLSMYNGIGLNTPRGTGTNGYVQKNLSFVNVKRDRVTYVKDADVKQLEALIERKGNAEILEHEKKRRIELKCVEMRDMMLSNDYDEETTTRKVQKFRKMLVEREGLYDTKQVEYDEHGRPVAKETHQLAQANEEKNRKLRQALGLGEFDPKEAARRKAEEIREVERRKIELAQKQYTIIQDEQEDEHEEQDDDSNNSVDKREKSIKEKDQHHSSSRKEKGRHDREHERKRSKEKQKSSHEGHKSKRSNHHDSNDQHRDNDSDRDHKRKRSRRSK
ncbi:unnamed protein product [Didymodactylos carnosus]|uniref:Serine/threonine-protein phosphatase PGAM5, mitochondrial n=1 Tax=Didymodactylos carnosus TaxID=1234261 RepID=A0A813VJL5_9BILA|nr:unnamed protein product [Didymodactylos carnosus]CAF0837586.1 unnamed protein product [Didymodactylos carnosus]CAF3508193.1 unnamed protein product [Didymodactylos carnosus]CAF3624843.1 unnamed protein product [Didymodactylos carnosus]